MIGDKFNRWTIIDEAPSRNGRKYYLCKCECGTIREVCYSSLKSGHSKSCGCYKKENLSKIKKEDLKNQKFGKLTVLYENGRTKNQHVIWHCLCECGNECDVIGSDLKQHKTQSCGCYQKEIISNIRKGNLTNQRFGKLIALYELPERKNGCVIWHCKCDCGNEKDIRSNDLIQKKILSCGCIKSKGEEEMVQILKENNISFEREKTFDNCRFLDTNRPAKFDFYINNKYIIEFDGIQHFEPRTFNGISQEKANQKFIYVQEHDKFKNQWCKENNIPIIRIPYTYLSNLCLEDLVPETSKFLLG